MMFELWMLYSPMTACFFAEGIPFPMRTAQEPTPIAMQFAIAAGGRAGLDQFWDLIKDEIGLTLAQIGQPNMADVRIQ